MVPDAPDALTSDHGCDLEIDGPHLRSIVRELQQTGIRVSLFVDPDPTQIARAKEIGADRIELYTESYALAPDNLGLFCRTIPNVLEVSIGHALIAYSLEVGLRRAVSEYRNAVEGRRQRN